VPQRALVLLFDAALGFAIDNARYRGDAEVSEYVASRDLKRLCDIGLMEPHVARRGRRYSRSEELRALRESVGISQPVEDPYDVIGRLGAMIEPRFPGLDD